MGDGLGVADSDDDAVTDDVVDTDGVADGDAPTLSDADGDVDVLPVTDGAADTLPDADTDTLGVAVVVDVPVAVPVAVGVPDVVPVAVLVLRGVSDTDAVTDCVDVTDGDGARDPLRDAVRLGVLDGDASTTRSSTPEALAEYRLPGVPTGMDNHVKRNDGGVSRVPAGASGTTTTTSTGTDLPTSSSSHSANTPDVAYAPLSHAAWDPVTAVTLLTLPDALNAALNSTTPYAGAGEWSEWVTAVVYVTVPPGHMAAVGGDTNGGCSCGCTAVSIAGVDAAETSTSTAVTRACGSTSNPPLGGSASDTPTKEDAITRTNPVTAVHVSVHNGTVTTVPSAVAIIGKKNSGPHDETMPRPLPST